MHKRMVFLLSLMVLLTFACRFSSDDPINPDPGSIGVPLPPNEDYGVLCFVEFQESIAASAPVFDSFYSRDGGLTWKQEGPIEGGISGSLCNPNYILPKEVWVPPDGMVRYRFTPGESIEVSLDKGQNWEVTYDLTEIQWEPVNPPDEDREVIVRPGPLDAMLDPNSGNLLLAMGHAGVLVGLPSGEWRWISAGRYSQNAVTPDQSATGDGATVEETQPPLSVLVLPDIEINTENNYVNALAFAPDGTVLAASGFEGGIKLYDFRKGDLLHWQQWGQDVQHRKLYGAAFSEDGKILITCGTNVDQILNIWDLASWELIKAFEGYQTSVLDTGFFNGKQYLAVVYQNQPKIFQLPEGKEISTVSGNLSDVSSVFFLPGTPYIAMGSASGEVEVWDYTRTESIFYSQPTMGPDSQTSLSNKVYTQSYDPSEDVMIALQGNGRLTAWEVPSGGLIRQLVLHIPHGWYISRSAFSEDGSLVAVGMQNGPLLLFDSRSGQVLSRQWIEDGGTLMQLAFSPNGDWLAAGFANGRVKIWQVDRLINQD